MSWADDDRTGWKQHLNPACRLVTGSAALPACGAASALLKLRKEARAGEQKQVTTGSRVVCKRRLSASAIRAEHVLLRCNSAGAALQLQCTHKDCMEANDWITAQFPMMKGTPVPAQVERNVARVVWQRLQAAPWEAAAASCCSPAGLQELVLADQWAASDAPYAPEQCP